MKSIAWLFEPLYRWLTAYMGRQGMILYGIFDCDCACAAPPDFSPVANASREAAEVMAALGREQIAEARRQYDTNLQVSRPVVDAQLALMRQGIQQGNDYYEYGKSFRPLEQQMLGEVSQGTAGVNAAERSTILNRANQQAGALLGEANAFSNQQAADIASVRREQEAAANRQVADTRSFVGSQTAMADQLRDRGLSNESALRSRSAEFEAEKRDLANQLRDRGLSNESALRSRSAEFEAEQRGLADQLRDRGLSNEAQLQARSGAFEADIARDVGLATGGRGAILNAYRDDIDADVGRAVADTRVGQTQALNTAMRQAMRMGLSVPSNVQSLTNQNAAQLASAANNTRTSSIENMRNVIRDGIGLKSNTFQIGQAATESAMNRGESALSNRLAAGRDTFTTGQAALENAMNRGESALAGRMAAGRDAFVTGQAATESAMNRGESALSNRMAAGRDTFITSQAALSDADNRRFSAGTTAIGQSADAFRTGTAARTSAFDRELSGLSANRNMRIQDQSLNWARQLDVTGMARGMPGASQGAYSVANQSGNSAVQNQMAPSNSFLSAVQGGIGAIGQGQQMRIGGLSNVLNAQTSFANSMNHAMNSGDGGMGGLGSVLGGVANLYSSGVFGSDRRLKEDIELVGQDECTGLNLYEFSYIDDPDQRRFVGVMADEVVERFPDAVGHDAEGFMTVNYARLGIEMKEVA